MSSTTSSTVPEAGPTPEGARIGFVNRVLGVFFSPGATFRDIGRAPKWLLPLLLILVFSIGVQLLVMEKIDTRGGIRAAMENQGITGKQLEDAVEQQAGFVEKYGIYLAVGGTIVALPIFYLLIGLVFWAGGSVMGGRITYGATLSVVIHSWMPKILEGILFLLVLMGKSEPVRSDLVGRVLLTNPAAFLPETAAGTPMYALASGLNLFTLWVMFLIGLGLSEAGKLSKGAAFGVVALLYGVWLAITIGFAALF